jgi:hypothetical protein
MKNVNLNPGGIIGALLMLATVIVIAVLASNPDSVGGRIGGFGVPALFSGAYCGNHLWERFVHK